MDSVKQEPEDISDIIASNLFQLYGSEEKEPEDLNVSGFQMLEEVKEEDLHEDEPKNDNVDYLFFSCQYCGARFERNSALVKHQFNKSVKSIKYRRGMRYKCNVRKCKRTFSCIQQRNEHVELYHPRSQPQIFKCSECSFIATNSSSLKTHSLLHKPMHRCDQCLYSFDTWTLLISHKDSHHKHACSQCGLKFGTRKDFREHQAQMGNFKCLLCEEDFECEYARSQHLERDHEEESNQLSALQHKELSELEAFDVEMKFECDHCGLFFDNRQRLLFHMRDHFKLPISCDDCGAKFSVLEHLIVHRKYYSGNFGCRRINCTKVFKCKQALTEHIRKDHEVIWKCSECPETFKTKKNLRAHCSRHHSKYQCDLCDLSFLKEKALRYHKWSFHKEGIINKFSCDKCEKKFKTLNTLRKHEFLTHLDQMFQSQIDTENSNRSVVDSKQILENSCTVTETLTFEDHIEKLAGYSIKEEPEDAFLDIKSHPMVASNKQKRTSEINQGLETVVKYEQEDTSFVTETLDMNIHLKEEPEVSYVLKFHSEEEDL